MMNASKYSLEFRPCYWDAHGRDGKRVTIATSHALPPRYSRSRIPSSWGGGPSKASPFLQEELRSVRRTSMPFKGHARS